MIQHERSARGDSGQERLRLREARLMRTAFYADALGAVRAVDVGHGDALGAAVLICRSSCAAQVYWMCAGWLRTAIWGAA
jgi:hypothetical protein